MHHNRHLLLSWEPNHNSSNTIRTINSDSGRSTARNSNNIIIFITDISDKKSINSNIVYAVVVTIIIFW